MVKFNQIGGLVSQTLLHGLSKRSSKMYRIENSKIAPWKQTYLIIRFPEKTIKIWKTYLTHIGTLMKHCSVQSTSSSYFPSKIYWYHNGPLCSVQSTGCILFFFKNILIPLMDHCASSPIYVFLRIFHRFVLISLGKKQSLTSFTACKIIHYIQLEKRMRPPSL